MITNLYRLVRSQLQYSTEIQKSVMKQLTLYVINAETINATDCRCAINNDELKILRFYACFAMLSPIFKCSITILLILMIHCKQEA